MSACLRVGFGPDGGFVKNDGGLAFDAQEADAHDVDGSDLDGSENRDARTGEDAGDGATQADGSDASAHDAAASSDAALIELENVTRTGTAGWTLASWSSEQRRLPDEGRVDGFDMKDNVLLLHFDESPGPVADGAPIEDSSGLSNTALAQNLDGSGLEFRAGFLGQALRFGGGDDAVIVRHTGALDLGTEWTLALWLFLETPVAAESRFIAAGDVAEGEGWEIRSYPQDDLHVRVNGAEVWTATDPLRPGAWQHLAITFIQGTALVYLNGALWQRLSGLDPGVVGTGLAVWVGQGFEGSIDELSLWTRALGEAEIERLVQRQGGEWGGGLFGLVTSPIFDSGTGPPPGRLSWVTGAPSGKPLLDGVEENGYPEGLVSPLRLNGLWHMEGSGSAQEGASVPDSGGASRSGIARNADASGLLYEPGLLGKALCFDGKDDHVELPPEVIRDETDFTFAAWVYWRGYIVHGAQEWQRIFDFGTNGLATASSGEYMYLTPISSNYEGTGRVLFSVSQAGYQSSEYLEGLFGLRPERWSHVAVVLEGTMGTLYVDGMAVGSGPISLRPVDLKIQSNWLGRSRFGSEDVPLWACLDEVALWGRALSPSEIAALHLRGATRVSLQVRACDVATECSLLPFVGPDGTKDTAFDEMCCGGPLSPSAELPVTLQKRYFQYRARLETLDSRVTPRLVDVRVD